MEQRTAFIVASLMMLANGSVLGFMHRDLPASLRPAAINWQVGTLLLAGGSAMFALAKLPVPPAVLLTAANGVIFLGLTAYWHAVRLFYGDPPRLLLLAPAGIGTLGVFLFIAIWPDTGVRIMIASAVWLTLMGGSWATLHAQAGSDTAKSRPVLMAIFAGVMLFTLSRTAYFLAVGVEPRFSVADDAAWMNMATTLVSAILPVIGTTAFLLMCSERTRRQWELAASTDYLTGLPNRRTLTQIGAERFAAGPEKTAGLALAVIDIDDFKTINDRHGHEIGDLALNHVARQLEACAG